MLIGPPVQMPPWIREHFAPEQRSAVDYLRRQIDESMLKEIAEADYAQDVSKHLAALMPIWNDCELAELNHWFPMEVLELIRWSEPEAPNWQPGSTGLRGHKLRAFSCAVLLATPNFEPDKETLIQMLDSLAWLGAEAQAATARFLVWRLDSIGHEEDRPFFALALAAIIQSITAPLPTAKEQDLADWVAGEEFFERAYLAEFHESYQDSPWMFGLSYNNIRNNRWKALIRSVQERSNEGPFGRMLADNYKA
ncbi:hypothetical protein [Rubritalea tangerina]|uniref:Uncharacterized protein n=1 Tax=Rubritalea tangerina TaxID=430798 RepID=A0ABW4Z9V0_9BACT